MMNMLLYLLMKVVTAENIKDKKVLLRLDIDIPIEDGKVIEDFRLKAGIPTLKLCIDNAAKIIILGHLGRPFTNAQEKQKGHQNLSAKPVCEWFENTLGLKLGFVSSLDQIGNSNAKIVMLENTRFFHGEVEGSIDFAKQLAVLGEIFVNEAFASHNPAASTTILPTLLPSYAGFRFGEEVMVLTGVRENPKKPFVVIMGGAKVEDKLPVIEVLAKKADAVLVGGKLVSEIREQNLELAPNIMVGKLNKDGLDIAPETVESWRPLLLGAAMIVWNGPVGRIEDPNLQFTIYNLQNKAKENLGSAKGTYELAKLILESQAGTVIGGGDTIAFLDKVGLLEKFKDKGFVSTGGGAMLKFLTKGSLPTIEALNV